MQDQLLSIVLFWSSIFRLSVFSQSTVTNLHVLGNVPAKLVDGETTLGCLFTTDEVDVGFLHEFNGF